MEDTSLQGVSKTQSDTLKLSVIVIVYNMQRAAPRSIQSLLVPYQQGIDPNDYEVLVIENGSQEPLQERDIVALGNNVRYFFVQEAPSSPAFAINVGVQQARGEILAIMVDGAHLVTPGILAHSLELFNTLKNPIVLNQAFFLGTGPQTETIFQGYNETQEDELLEGIDWLENGYRLFEISYPYKIEYQGKPTKLFWFVRLFESNCLFMRKATFECAGGCDERFNLPGGGLLIPSLYKEAADLDDTEIVQVLGEASFHQLHGGVSTNISAKSQLEQWQRYADQYAEIFGRSYAVTQKAIKYYGHMPNWHARQFMF